MKNFSEKIIKMYYQEQSQTAQFFHKQYTTGIHLSKVPTTHPAYKMNNWQICVDRTLASDKREITSVKEDDQQTFLQPMEVPMFAIKTRNQKKEAYKQI